MTLLALVAALVAVVPGAGEKAPDAIALANDDECTGEACAVNALQVQSRQMAREAEDAGASEWTGDAVLVGGNETWASCAAYGCNGYSRYRPCQCNSKCYKYHNCCGDYYNRCILPARSHHQQHHQQQASSHSGAACSAVPACRSLHGNCCPTASGSYLGCCPESMIPHGSANPTTVEHGRHVMKVYHQTSPQICKLIMANGFKLGHSGWCGGAIYFAMTPEATRTKAITPHSGVGCMIEAKVDVGRMKTYPCCRYCGGRQDQQIGWTESNLRASGYDSIEINPGDGPELVIYNNNRVVSMRTIPFDPAWTPHKMHGNW
mmetsp:Transcript_53619/g.124895  ORF Transcript_53619/g.124895 Transcript_53619/m.124895 type:complete len:319 (+) Transcript_53619:58-1014(+)